VKISYSLATVLEIILYSASSFLRCIADADVVQWGEVSANPVDAAAKKTDMVDRASRDQMIAVIRSYMDDQITAFQFDDTLGAIGGATEDETARAVVRDLWFYYDDCTDHNIVASKKVWDYFNRLLLLLASEAEIEVVRVWRNWPTGQLVAGISLACFCFLVARTGTRWGPDLFMLAMPFGVVSMVICWFNFQRRKKVTTTLKAALDPFPTLSSLLDVRRKTRDFEKMRYPRVIADRRIRGPVMERLPWILWGPLWLMFSPIVLFVQMLPMKGSETVVATPELGCSGTSLHARS
jgi:hypothetical protein